MSSIPLDFQQVLELCRRIQRFATGAAAAASDIHTECEQLIARSNEFIARLETSENEVAKKWFIVVSDLLVRLKLVLKSEGKDVEALARIWVADDLAVLDRRLSLLQGELDKQTPTTNRVVPMDMFGTETLVSPTSTTNAPSSKPNPGRTELLQGFLLDSLSLPSMGEREDQVTEAYSKTFEWIYADKGHNLAAWFKGEKGGAMYWINGLPGSGKSTLMRYIHEQKRTQQLLVKWAGARPITVASFFFWESGTAIQRSQAGLLRSLLSQLLTRQPRLIEVVFPALWQQLWEADARTRVRLTSSWSTAQLSDAFRRFFAANAEHNVCLIVDGLDEYEGDHSVTIGLLEEACQHTHTKACVSSRPWPVFEAAFEGILKMRLQGLTAGDMVSFARGRLSADERVRKMVVKDSAASESLVRSLVEGADGVFLWISLVVRTLLDGFAPNDTISDLQTRLQELPQSLDKLFHHLILKREDDVAATSRIFQLVRAREAVTDFTRDDNASALTVWEMSLTDSDTDEEVLKAKIARVGHRKLVARCKLTTSRLEERCAGLLQVHESRDVPDPGDILGEEHVDLSISYRKITYLHRTVKDWLVNSGVWEDLIKRAPPFDPHICHLRACILLFKHCRAKPKRTRMLNEWWSTIALAMTHARFAQHSSHESSFNLLNNFDETLNWYWPTTSAWELDSWARSAFGSYEERGQKPYPHAFLSLAIRFGIVDYVEDYLDEYECEYEGGAPLMIYATEYLVHRQSSIFPLSNPRIVEILLRNGHDPNLSYPVTKKRSGTPWIAVLQSVQQAYRRRWMDYYDVNADGLGRWMEILRLFVEKGGAAVDVVIPAGMKDSEETAVKLLTRIQDIYHSKNIEIVLEMLASMISAR